MIVVGTCLSDENNYGKDTFGLHDSDQFSLDHQVCLFPWLINMIQQSKRLTYSPTNHQCHPHRWMPCLRSDSREHAGGMVAKPTFKFRISRYQFLQFENFEFWTPALALLLHFSTETTY